MRKRFRLPIPVLQGSSGNISVLLKSSLCNLGNDSQRSQILLSHIERGATKLGLPTLVSIANALGVTADDLLCDSLSAAEGAFSRETEQLLADCTHREKQILLGTLRALKEQLRKEP